METVMPGNTSCFCGRGEARDGSLQPDVGSENPDGVCSFPKWALLLISGSFLQLHLGA